MQHVGFATVLVTTFLFCAVAIADGSNRIKHDSSESPATITWHDDYHAGLDMAESEGKFALIWFYDPASLARNTQFENQVLNDARVLQLIDERCVATRLPIDVSAVCKGESVTLLEHPAFAEMQRQSGLVLVDMTEPDGPLHQQVVSILPFIGGEVSAAKLAVMLDLPRGTLTQRTLIYAVRTHPEAPASTSGHLSPILTRETENHAWHQANITLQGHHNWNSRFHSINAQLPGGMAAREVCAESWPGQNLLQAAEECVHSWRQSSGHWEAVRSRHALFGYDMKRGRNGVWYATGIFAGRN